MGTIVIEDFKIGLDRRRMNETSLPGSLVTCENAYITRGGEIEKAEAFIRAASLPDNTFGLVAVGNGFFVFGSDNITPTVLCTNPLVRYQRLADGTANMIDVLSATLFDGVPYVAAEYDDGIIRHFYNGVKVADAVSGKARAKFTILADHDTVSAKKSSGSFDITDVVLASVVSSVKVGTVELLASSISIDPDIDDLEIVGTYQQKIVDAINDNSNVSGFTATLSAARKITVSYQIPGALKNGEVVTVVSSSVTVSNISNMAGGVNAKKINSVEVNSVNVLPTPVDWVDSDRATASAVAEAINSNSATTGYEAYSIGSTVLVRSTTNGTAPNGNSFVVTKDADISITNASAVMSGGTASPGPIEPGTFVKTFKNKMYSLAFGTVDFSQLDVPNTYSGTGSGFINLSTNTSGSEKLLAMASYFGNMAILSAKTIEIWFMSDDPTENSRVQVLKNTGTVAPKSVTEFGDSDIAYISESGIRSIRARDTTNTAFINDIGIAIDEIIQRELLNNGAAVERAVGFLEPRQGRLIQIIGETVYIFSFFPSSKISAWSTLRPGFEITGIDSIGQTVVVRSDDAIYKIGTSISREYDSRPVKFVTPFLSGNDPSVLKVWQTMDIACNGTWDIYVASDPRRINEDGTPDESYFRKIGTVTDTTFPDESGENGAIEVGEVSSHLAIMCICRAPGYARVGKIALHIGDTATGQGSKL